LWGVSQEMGRGERVSVSFEVGDWRICAAGVVRRLTQENAHTSCSNCRHATPEEIDAVPFAEGDHINMASGRCPGVADGVVGVAPNSYGECDGWRHATPQEYRAATQGKRLDDLLLKQPEDDPLEQSSDDGERALVNAALQKLRKDVDAITERDAEITQRAMFMNQRITDKHADAFETIHTLNDRLEALEAKPPAHEAGMLYRERHSKKVVGYLSGPPHPDDGVEWFTLSGQDRGKWFTCALEPVPTEPAVDLSLDSLGRTHQDLWGFYDRERILRQRIQREGEGRHHPIYTAACCLVAAVSSCGATLWAMGAM